MKSNFHTHTYRCKHAVGDVDDYCIAAIEQGFDVLGMSDHTPIPDNRWIDVRMDINELDSYCDSLDQAQIRFPNIKLLKGMECEYIPEFHSFLEDELLGLRGLDYLVGAAHFVPDTNFKNWSSAFSLSDTSQALEYADYFIKTMETGLFTFMAHPDIYAIPFETWNEDLLEAGNRIIDASQELKIPLELNCNGFRKVKKINSDGTERFQYPRKEFWQLAIDKDIDVIVNSDAHAPGDLSKDFDLAEAWVKEFNLNLIDVKSLFKI